MCSFECIRDFVPSSGKCVVEIGEIRAMEDRRVNAADVVKADLKGGGLSHCLQNTRA